MDKDIPIKLQLNNTFMDGHREGFGGLNHKHLNSYRSNVYDSVNAFNLFNASVLWLLLCNLPAPP